jgi:hypothetical protein
MEVSVVITTLFTKTNIAETDMQTYRVTRIYNEDSTEC